MVSFNRNELRKLSAVCEDRRYGYELVRDNAVDGANYSYLERCLAAREVEYMESLTKKLLSVADSNARRIEVTL